MAGKFELCRKLLIGLLVNHFYHIISNINLIIGSFNILLSRKTRFQYYRSKSFTSKYSGLL